MTVWLATNLVAAALLPPLILVLLLAAGLILQRRRPRLATSLIVLAASALYALSTPWVSGLLLKSLEISTSLNPAQLQAADAIVVLGGGRRIGAAEYGGDTLKGISLERLRYAAHLHRALKKPVLVTGGAPLGNSTSEAAQMKQVLQQEFQVPVQWSEQGSNNTLENARLSHRLLNSAGVRRVYLVTDAWHMPRARLAFEHVGFTVIPAPTSYSTSFGTNALDFLPSAGALSRSGIYFHEVIGLGWYHLRIAIGR